MAQPPKGPPMEIMGDSIADLKATLQTSYQLIHGFWFTQLFYVVAELAVPDLIQKDGPQTADELAAKLPNCDASRLFRVLRAFQTLGGFTLDDQNRFGLTTMSRLLLSNHPMGQRNVARINGSPERYGSFMYMLSMVRGGDIGWMQHNKVEIYEYVKTNPTYAEVFHPAMTGRYARVESDAMVASYDFGAFGTVCDVGGGEGLLVQKMLAKFPSVKGILVDQPEVQQENEKNQALANIQKVSSDIFAPGGVPSGADFFLTSEYILKNVVHDHAAEKNVLLLKNIHDALKESSHPNKCLLIMENIISTDYSKQPDLPKLFDMVFMLLSNAQERTHAEYSELVQQAGFVLNRVITPPPGAGATSRCIIECKPV